MSYFSQMVGLASHNFFSAAVGIVLAAALVRGISRDRSRTIGNFWRDLVRTHLYLLLPICVCYAIFLVSQGMVQNFKPYTTATSLDQSGAASTTQPSVQSIAQGPVASQVAIKMLGTNGGGFYNANAAHPFENPTPLSNLIQILSIFAIPTGLTYYLGRMVKQQGHGWAVWAAMFILFLAGALVLWHFEAAGNPRFAELGVDPASGNMEGKEVRFGIFNSALFATITTDASCGAVNCMHDSLTPIGGLVPMFNIHLGEVVFGGVGAGLYGMLVFVIIAIFIAGLMVGRTPEYLGKKIEAYDVKAASLAILVLTVIILGFTAWACVSDWGVAGLNNNGPHGFSEMHYAYTSGAGNNGSAFAGLTTNTPWWNTTMAFDFLLGRFFMIVPILALAGHLGQKKIAAQSAGSFPVNGATFTLLLIGVVVIVGALTFLPALALGPIVEHFLMTGSKALF
jgi:K+-transporting ATPase ATPase A chain